jgi:hypothetical protein
MQQSRQCNGGDKRAGEDGWTVASEGKQLLEGGDLDHSAGPMVCHGGTEWPTNLDSAIEDSTARLDRIIRILEPPRATAVLKPLAPGRGREQSNTYGPEARNVVLLRMSWTPPDGDGQSATRVALERRSTLTQLVACAGGNGC